MLCEGKSPQGVTLTNIKLREAVVNDLSRLLDLEQKIVDSERPYDAFIKEDNVTYYDLKNLISEPGSYLVVVESEREIIGTGYAQIRSSKSCHLHDKHCYLGFIYLEPEHRGKAIGSAILDALKDWGVKQGLRNFHLDVYAENVSAIRAYEKAGFNKISVKMELVV